MDKEEQKYERARKLAQELHIPVPLAFLTLEVFDKDGKLIRRHRQRSHSWTRNAYNMLFSTMAGCGCPDSTFEAGKLSGKDTSGAVKYGVYCMAQHYTCQDGTTSYGYRAPATDDDRGILVGSGTDAESFEDYALQTKIAEGSGAGQLNHVLSEAVARSYAAVTQTSTLIRYFNNNSGGSIDVNEVALVPKSSHSEGAGYNGFFLMSRDKLASTVSVPDTGQLKVTYTIQLTYPS